jgi:hypothetical protein
MPRERVMAPHTPSRCAIRRNSTCLYPKQEEAQLVTPERPVAAVRLAQRARDDAYRRRRGLKHPRFAETVPRCHA